MEVLVAAAAADRRQWKAMERYLTARWMRDG